MTKSLTTHLTMIFPKVNPIHCLNLAEQRTHIDDDKTQVTSPAQPNHQSAAGRCTARTSRPTLCFAFHDWLRARRQFTQCLHLEAPCWPTRHAGCNRRQHGAERKARHHPRPPLATQEQLDFVGSLAAPPTPPTQRYVHLYYLPTPHPQSRRTTRAYIGKFDHRAGVLTVTPAPACGVVTMAPAYHDPSLDTQRTISAAGYENTHIKPFEKTLTRILSTAIKDHRIIPHITNAVRTPWAASRSNEPVPTPS